MTTSQIKVVECIAQVGASIPNVSSFQVFGLLWQKLFDEVGYFFLIFVFPHRAIQLCSCDIAAFQKPGKGKPGPTVAELHQEVAVADTFARTETGVTNRCSE